MAGRVQRTGSMAGPREQPAHEPTPSLVPSERQKVEERQALSAEAVAETLRLEGRNELERRWQALAWSALAAGISIGLSLVAQGVLRLHLPDTSWRRLVVSLGYSVGFLVVTLGRQQLYTETTLTALLPVLDERSTRLLGSALRLWAVVLLANLAGAFLFAWAAAASPVFSPELREAFRQIAHEAVSHDPWTAFVKGIAGGWVIALMVWLLPSADVAKIWIVVALTFLLSASDFTHVIAGSVDALYLVVTRELSPGGYLWQYALPVLAGNTAGGVLLVAALNHAQLEA